MVIGLVAMDELGKNDAMIDSAKTSGLSGGSWSVLVNEALGASEALNKIDAYLAKDPKHSLGIDFSGWKAGGINSRANLWKTFSRWKDEYVKSVIHTPLGPDFSFKQDGKAIVLVGASIQTPPGGAFPQWIPPGMADCVFSFFGSGSITGWLKCSAAHNSFLFKPTMRRLQSVAPYAEITGKSGDFDLSDREIQATLSSMAWLFLSMSIVMPKKGGLPVKPDMANGGGYYKRTGGWYSLDTALWDLGIDCNIAAEPGNFGIPGTTLAIDASADDDLFESYDSCLSWWKSSFAYECVPVANPTYVKWNGKTLDLRESTLGKTLRKYIRLCEMQPRGGTKKTGRKILTITFGKTFHKHVLDTR